MPALSLGTLTPKMTQSWTQFHCWVGPKLERVKQSFLSCRLRERTERQYNELVTALFPGSSMVEHSAVNRRVASSNLARGAKPFNQLERLTEAAFSNCAPFCAPSVSKLPSDKVSIARLCAACPIWPYRRDIRTVVLALHPMTEATTEKGMPPSNIRVHPVCRRS